jgi:regulator of replication initiation timing
MESAFQAVFDKLDNLTRKVDKMALEEVALRKAYRQSTAETAALKATVDTLTKQLDERIVLPAPPLPDPATSPSAMEEMTMQLSHVQHDIQDVLEAVCNPPGKRKRWGSNQNTGPTMPTNQRPATNKKRDASPEHSLMHSQHATSAAQDALDALIRKYPPRPLAITSTEATTDPLPDSTAVQDTTLPDAPTTTAPAEKDGWKTVEGKAAQKKRRNEKADNKWAMEPSNKPPTTKTGGRGKNSHQPRTTDTSAKKTWAEVVQSGGINVQIVLGNGNLGLATPPTKKRGERRGGAARRLGRKDGVGERGEESRGKVG